MLHLMYTHVYVSIYLKLINKHYISQTKPLIVLQQKQPILSLWWPNQTVTRDRKLWIPKKPAHCWGQGHAWSYRRQTQQRKWVYIICVIVLQHIDTYSSENLWEINIVMYFVSLSIFNVLYADQFKTEIHCWQCIEKFIQNY